MISSAEHFTYHIQATDNFEISPFMSLLRFKQISNVVDTNNPDGIVNGLSFALGLELNRYFKNFVLSPYAEYNVTYNGRIHGFNIGVYLGYSFKKIR